MRVAKTHTVWYFLLIWSFSAKHCRLEHHFWPVQAYVYPHSSTLFPRPFPLHFCTLFRAAENISYVRVYFCGAAISNSFLLSFNCGLIWMERRTEGTEQNRHYADHAKKMDNKNYGRQNHWSVCILRGEEERRALRVSRGAVKIVPWHMYLTCVKLLGPLF